MALKHPITYGTLVGFLLLAGSASAQFSSLAPAGDGSQLYFVTSIRLASELSQNLPDTPAIYRIQSGAIERITLPLPYNPAFYKDYVGNPQVSGDGNVFSYTEYHVCVGGSTCLFYPASYQSYVSVAGQPYGAPFGTQVQISRNGRFAVGAMAGGGELHDLQTGAVVQIPVVPSGPRQAITSNGRVLGFDAQTGALAIWSSQGAASLSPSERPATAIVNDAATWVVYETAAAPSGVHLRALELSSGRDVLLASRATAGFNASISDDGSLVLYLTEPGQGQGAQAWAVRPDGTGRFQLTDFPEGVDEAVIAGRGLVAFAATGSRLVEMDVHSGAVQELIGRTPQCTPGFVSLIPGSILPIRGTALAASTEVAPVPLPYALGGVRVLADGAPLPLLSVSPTEIWFQVPFELPLRPSIAVELDHSSAFEGCPAVNVAVVARAPYFFNSGNLVVAHQDFSGLVTNSSPAQPGEVIHLYAVGLGAVTPAATTGIPTPLNRLFRLADPFECHTGPAQDGQSLDVTFAGLAPGMIGIYQVDMRMPDTWPDSWPFVNCGTPGSAVERGGGGIPFGRPQ